MANIGYLFLKYIYHDLGLDKICSDIASRHKFEYDLNDILAMLIYSRIIFPSSKKSSLEQAMSFLEQPSCKLQHIYRALEILSKENDFIQAQLYKNSTTVVNRNKAILYYDCTNYYFEIEKADQLRKYGISKEHRPNPIVQMGLFMDADGIPLAFSVFPGNQNEQPSLKPLEKQVIKDFGASRFIVCTDAGLASTANRKFNSIQGRRFVTAQPIKKLKDFLQDFCLNDDDWCLPGSKKKYKLSELNEETDKNKIFYKSRPIIEDGLEQQLIVTYSLKQRNYARAIRDAQIERAEKFIETKGRSRTSNPNDIKRFVKSIHVTQDGEIASNTYIELNDERIAEEEKYDGFFAVCTNLEDDPVTVVGINAKRWKIEECFRIMKSEFKARPVYLSRKDRITAHFITCFTALIVYRILEKSLDEKFTCSEIIETLRNMNMLVSPGDGFIPAYTRTDITDALHDTFGFRTDYEITSQINMKKICTLTRKHKK